MYINPSQFTESTVDFGPIGQEKAASRTKLMKKEHVLLLKKYLW